MFKIEYAQSPIFHINIKGTKGVELVLKDKENDVSYPIKQTISFSDDMRDFSVKQNESRKDGYRAFLYSRETLVMQPIAELQAALKEYFQNNPEKQECLLLLNPVQLRCIISGVPKEVRYIDNEVKVDKKADLKAYETPQEFLDILVSAIARTYEMQLKLIYAKKYLEKMAGSSEFLKAVGLNREKFKKMIPNALRTMQLAMEKGYKDFEKVIIVMPKKVLDVLKRIYEAVDFKELNDVAKEFGIPIYKPYASFVDMQAGSGKALLGAMDKNGLEGVLHGTEFRKIENDDPRYQVITDVNFIPYASAIESALNKKTVETNVKRSFFWLNPPYTTDDYVARESVEILPKGVFMAGLFPVKMLNFLKKRINGYIYVIPKEITGYEGGNIPQEFLFVMGHRNNIVTDNVLSQNVKGAIVVNVSRDKTIEDFSQDIFKTLNEKLYFDLNVKSAIEYFNANDERLGMFGKHLRKEIEQKREMLEKTELIESVLQAKIDDILSAFLPTKNAMKMRLFPDMRFFSKDGKYEKLRFYDVANNIPLLEYYKNIVPSLFKIVANIAKEIGVTLPVDDKEGAFRPFDLENPQNYVKEKECVTNSDLGMMKLYYYPNVLLLRTEEQKRRFFEMAKEIILEEYERVMEERGSDDVNGAAVISEVLQTLEEYVENADRLVVKSAKSYLEADGAIGNSDVFVFVDDFGLDLGKLNIPITDIYQKMEEKGYFKLEDVVELAQMPDEKKEKIIDNFFVYFDAVLQDIHRYLVNEGRKENSFDEFKKEVLLKGKEIIAMLKAKTSSQKINREIVKWAKANDFDKYFESKFIMPNTSSMVKQSIDKHLDFLPKAVRKNLFEMVVTRVDGRIIPFYENERYDFISSLKENIEKFVGGMESFDEKFESFVISFNDALIGEYNIRSAIISSYAKLADFFIKEYTIANLMRNAKKSNVEIFDKIFKDLLVRRFKLRPHQAEEAMRYCAIEDEKRLEMLYWEMRAGKTRAMIAIGFMLGLLKGDKDIDLVLETANMPDIAQQLFESFPFMMANANFFVGDENKLQFINNENIFTTLPSEEIYLNLIKIFQKNLVGKGDAANEMKKTLLEDYELIVKAIEDGKIDVDRVLQSYEKTPFGKLMEICR